MAETTATIRLGNVNTFWIVGVGLAAFVGNYYVYGYKVNDIAERMAKFEAAYATADKLKSTSDELTRDINSLSSGLDGVRVRLDGLSASIATMNVSLGQHDVNIKNLQDTVTELRRQSRSYTPIPPSEFRSDSPSIPIPNLNRGSR